LPARAAPPPSCRQVVVAHLRPAGRRRWLQTAFIPSLPRPFNQTKNWDRPILQTKHPNGIIPILKSGMVSSHPT
jgi:hypothetical protein